MTPPRLPEEIKTKQDTMDLVFKLTRFEMQYPRFVQDRAFELCEEIILGRIHQKMRELEFSQKIIDATRLEFVKIDTDGFIDLKIISDYQSDTGFDVSLAREKGTVRHFIAPVVASVLSWIVGGFIRAFSKGHWVSGITKSNVIEKMTEETMPIVQARLNADTDAFLDRSLQ